MAFNIPKPQGLATPQIGQLWHQTKIILFGREYSILDLFQSLNEWNSEGNQAERKVCNLERLCATLSVTYYLLTSLDPDPNSGQSPPNLPKEELQKHIRAGRNCFWQFTHLLSSLENDTQVGSVALEAKTLRGLYVKNLEGSKEMNFLRESVGQNYNPVVMQRLEQVMDGETWQKLDDDLRGIKGATARRSID